MRILAPIFEATKLAKRRLYHYFEIVYWLASQTANAMRYRLIGPIILALASFTFELISLFLMVHVIGRIQQNDSPNHSDNILGSSGQAVIGFIDQLPITYLSAAIPVLLMLSGLTRYIFRTLALDIERRLALFFLNMLLEKIASLNSAFERWALINKLDIKDVIRASSTGSRMGAVVVRLCFFNIINFVYLISGLIIIAFLSPILIIFIIITSILGILLSYPINVKAIRISQELEISALERATALTQQVRQLMGGKLSKNNTQDQSRYEFNQTERAFLNDLMQRLSVLETSNLFFSIILSIALGLFFFLITNKEILLILEFSNILIIVICLRYTFNGFSGIMNLLTSTNRMMPNIIRLHGSIKEIDNIKYKHNKYGFSASDIDRDLQIPWKIKLSKPGQATGVLKNGTTNLIVCPLDSHVDLTYQFLELLPASTPWSISAGFDKSMQALTAVDGYAEIARSGTKEKPKKHSIIVTWISEILAACDIRATPDQIANAIAGDVSNKEVFPDLIRLLASVHIQIKNKSSFILINSPSIFEFDLLTGNAKTVFGELEGYVVFIITPWLEFFGENIKFADHVFVSNGYHINFSGNATKMGDPEWKQASSKYKAVSGSTREVSDPVSAESIFPEES